MRFALSTAAFAVVVFMLGACAPVVTSPDPSTPTGPTAAATPTPTPRPTPPASDDWGITGNGIGPVTIGSPIAAIDPGTDGVILTTLENGCPAFSSPQGWKIVSPADPVNHVDLSRTGLDDPTDSPRTAEGVGLDSTAEEVAAAYPGIELTDDGRLLPHYVVPEGERYIVIFLEEGRVKSILVTGDLDIPLHVC